MFGGRGDQVTGVIAVQMTGPGVPDMLRSQGVQVPYPA